jgi:hypothetical protein
MRRVFRERYIGAVLVGFLLYNFVTEVIRCIENPIMLWIQRMVQHSALSGGQPWFNKGQLIASLVDAAFYLLAGVLIGLWIYRSDPVSSSQKA